MKAGRLQTFLERIGFEFRQAPRTTLFAEKAIDPFFRYINEMSDPDEVLAAAGKTRKALTALAYDDEISAAIDTRVEALLAVPWRLENRNGKRDDIPEPVQWLWDQIEPHAERILRAAMHALPYGYSVIEATYRREGTRIVWDQIAEKPFWWFIPRLDGTVLYRSQAVPQGEETDPRKFFLTARQQTYVNPYGEALFSRLYWAWFFRQQGWRFWCRWLERFGSPLLVGKTAGDARGMADALASAVQGASAAIGMGDDVVIVENKSGGSHFEGFERAVCARIQKMILGQTLTSDSGGSSGKSGSYALGQVHNEVRKDRRDADIRMVKATAQRMVDVLWELNGFAGKPPSFVLAEETGLELDRAARDAELANAGIVKFTPEYLLRVYDFEPEDLDIDAMKEPPETSPAAEEQPEGSTPPPARKASAAAFSSRRFTRSQQAVEDSIDEILPKLSQAIDNEQIKAAIRAASDPGDLIDRLAVLLADEPRGVFQTVVERALFAADLLGYIHAREDSSPTH